MTLLHGAAELEPGFAIFLPHVQFPFDLEARNWSELRGRLTRSSCASPPENTRLLQDPRPFLETGVPARLGLSLAAPVNQADLSKDPGVYYIHQLTA